MANYNDFKEAYEVMQAAIATVGTLTATQRRAIEMVEEYSLQNSYDCDRGVEAIRLVVQDLVRCADGGNANSGLAGMVNEITNRPATSRVIGVAPRGKRDSYLKVWNEEHTEFILRPCEHKTNGGRLGTILATKAVDTSFVAYKFDEIFEPSKRFPEERRLYAHKVMTVREFIELIEDTNAIKGGLMEHKGKGDAEPGLKQKFQPLYRALVEGNYRDYNRDDIVWI